MTKIAPDALAAEGNPWLSAGVLALAVGAEMLRSNGMLGFLPTGRPHANKPFATFDEFYPYYLREHSDIWTKRLHYLGTALMIVLILLSRRLILPIVAGAAVGFVVFPFFRHIGTGLPEMALMVGTYVLTGYAATKSWRQVLLPLVIAYGCVAQL